MFPLSIGQKNIWNVERGHAETSINTIGSTILMRGRWNVSLTQQSIHMVIAVAISSRTRIGLKQKESYQYHVEWQEEQFPVFDFFQRDNWKFRQVKDVVAYLQKKGYVK